MTHKSHLLALTNSSKMPSTPVTNFATIPLIDKIVTIFGFMECVSHSDICLVQHIVPVGANPSGNDYCFIDIPACPGYESSDCHWLFVGQVINTGKSIKEIIKVSNYGYDDPFEYYANSEVFDETGKLISHGLNKNSLIYKWIMSKMKLKKMKIHQ